MKLLAVHTTVGTRADADRIADTAVERGLAGCVHVDEIASVYRWKGALQHDTELRLTFKTTEEMRDALCKLIVELHPYELPALWAVELAHVHPPYAEWVRAATGGA